MCLSVLGLEGHRERRRAASVIPGARAVEDAAAAAVLEADFRRMKEELDRSRRESRRIEEDSHEARLKLEQERIALLARTSERDQVVNMAKDVANFASEAT